MTGFHPRRFSQYAKVGPAIPRPLISTRLVAHSFIMAPLLWRPVLASIEQTIGKQNLHVRHRDLDASTVERKLDPLVVLPADPPLLDGGCLDAGLEDDAAVGKFVHPNDLDRLEYRLGVI